MSAPHLKDGDESVLPSASSRSENLAVCEDDEIDLLEYWQRLVAHQRMIFGAMVGAAVLSAMVVLLIPNTYRAEVLMAPVSSEDGKSGLSSMLSGSAGLGSLASLAGLSLGGGGSAEENLAILQSKEFLWKFVQENNLMPVLFERKWWQLVEFGDPPGQWDVYRLIVEGNVLSVTKDKKTDMITVAVEWTDPEAAAKWANAIITRFNQYMAQKAIIRSESNLNYLNEELKRNQIEEMRKTLFDLVANEQKNAMLAKTQEEYVFRVIDSAVAPDEKSKPKRVLIVIVATILAGLLSAMVALVLGGYRSRKVTD